MNLKKAIDILELHQKWRNGDDDIIQTNARELTQSICVIIDVFKNYLSIMGKYNKAQKSLCPECLGDKIVMYYNEKERCNEEQPCGTCEGEGIVYLVRNVLSINDFKKIRNGK